jgi:PD-(D/E)XK nuclease superfamily
MVGGFNVFEVLGAVKQEIRHSNLLAWLMRPAESHGLSDYPLRRFLWLAASAAREQGISTFDPLETESLDLDQAIVEREWRGIDILIRTDSDSSLWAIENKVDSGESGDQLRRYESACEAEYPGYRKSFIFLTAAQREPSRPNWTVMGYDTILGIVERALTRKTVAQEVQVLLRHYTEILRRHIMRESEIDVLCQRIYSRHRQALDLIFEFRLDAQLEVRQILEEALTEHPQLQLDKSSKSLIRFAPAEWEPSGHSLGDGSWTPSGRLVLFEFNNMADALKLHLYVGPGNESVRELLFAHLRGDQGSPVRVPQFVGKKWTTVWLRQVLSQRDYEDWDSDAARAKIKQFLSDFVQNELPSIDGVMRRALSAVSTQIESQ